MSYKVTKTYVEHLEITTVRRDFMRHSSFCKFRNDKPKCEICMENFKPEDNMNLAFVVGKRNHCICDNCTDEAIKGGAIEIKEEEK